MKKIIIPLLLFFFLLLFMFPVCASEVTAVKGYQLVPVDADQEEKRITKIEVRYFDIEPEPFGIWFFSVDESNGDIALLTKNNEYCIVSIYTNEMEFKMSIRFKWVGAAHLELHNGFLNVFVLRTHKAYSFNTETKQVKIYDIVEDSNESNYNSLTFTDTIKINNQVYMLKNKSPFLDNSVVYSMLVRYDNEGNETVLYESNNTTAMQIFRLCIRLLVLPGVIFVFVIYILRRVAKNMKERGAEAKTKDRNEA